MKNELIPTENYLLIVDDSEIKENDWVFNSHKVEFAPQIYKMPHHPIEGEWWDEEELSTTKKIIFHLPLNNSPVLEGVDLLPPIEHDIDSWINETIKNLDDEHTSKTAYMCLKAGYNKAKEKYKYTEEHLRKAIDMARMNYDEEGFTINAFTEYEIIKSLQQPKMPVGFECESDYIGFQDEGDLKVPQSFINSQGQTVWVGKYIFKIKNYE
jgi:hypothetical protein